MTEDAAYTAAVLEIKDVAARVCHDARVAMQDGDLETKDYFRLCDAADQWCVLALRLLNRKHAKGEF